MKFEDIKVGDIIRFGYINRILVTFKSPTSIHGIYPSGEVGTFDKTYWNLWYDCEAIGLLSRNGTIKVTLK